MIFKRHLKKICSGDYTLIENYEKAVNDDTQTWFLHHRDGEDGTPRDELIRRGLYYGCPPEKLMFVTHADHNRIHNAANIDKLRERASGDNSPCKREDVRKKMSESAKNSVKHQEHLRKLNASKKGVPISAEARRKQSESLRGHKVSDITKKRISEAQINDPKKSKRCLQFTQTGELVAEWPSIIEACRHYGCAVRDCTRGKSRTAYGYIWAVAS